jgi:ornithine carbamoyltransferase
MKHLISLKEQSKEDILSILHKAQDLKEQSAKNNKVGYLKNKTMIMLFQKTSTRTRLSYEAAMTELGGHAIFLDARTSQFALTDFVDEIKAVMRFGQILMFRALKSENVIKAAALNQIPIIDGCSEKYHPSQALSDLLTMVEYADGLDNIKKVVWLGIENNVSNTLMLVCSKLGIKFVLVCPKTDKDSIDSELIKQAEDTGLISRTLDLEQALQGASFVHTDTWMNMEFFAGDKIKEEYLDEYNKRKELFMPYQLNAELIDKYAPQVKIMHCMPCHVGYEISRDAIDHKNSIIFDQAANRLHMQKAMILWLYEK